MMKVDEFIGQLEKAASCSTLYVMGCFGWPMTESNKARCIKEEKYNQRPERKQMIEATDVNVFGFDCVNLIKGILWGWDGVMSLTYGGAKYKSNGVPDFGADSFFNLCPQKYTDFSRIRKGAAVWMHGHIGVYIGQGKVIECSPRWQNGVQITHLANTGNTMGHSRIWTAWGLIPFVDYDEEKETKPTGIYNKVDECPEYARDAVGWFVSEKIITGINAQGDLGLDSKDIRTLTILYRTLKNRGLIK